MPWINKDMCTGCEACVTECSVGAISMNEGIAGINDNECIRCGVCHDVCPVDAVRHDGEKVPEEVESNLVWVKRLLAHEYYSGNTEREKALVERMKRYFTKECKVAEKTITQLDTLL